MSTVGSFPDMGPPPAHCAQGSHTLQARCFLLQCSASVAFLRLDRVVRVATNAGILVAHTSPAQDGGSGSRTVAPAVLHTQSRQERIPRKEGGRYLHVVAELPPPDVSYLPYSSTLHPHPPSHSRHSLPVPSPTTRTSKYLVTNLRRP